MSEEIRKILENHERRISELEKIFKEKPIKKPTTEYTGLPARILELRDKEFFKNPKTAKEVQLVLKTEGFYYMAEIIRMTLLRLVRKKELRRIVLEKKRGFTYVYP